MVEDLPENLLTVDQAIGILDALPVAQRVKEQRIDDAGVLGLILAQDIVADRDYPPFDRALMDGVAVRSEDGSASRRLVGEVAAGHVWERSVGSGECVAIMTGAPVPPGADAVVPVEQITRRADGQVDINAAVTARQSIAYRGSDRPAGEVVLRRGATLTPAALAVLATVGAVTVKVYARPRVGVLTTGDEIIPIDGVPTGAQIRNSNNLLLCSMVRTLGAEPIDLGHVRDDPGLIRDAIERASVDVLLVTGGMSMGEYDYVPRVLKEMGYELPITKLKIKPGKPFVMGIRDRGLGLSENNPQSPIPSPHPPRIIFGLPGNPVSAYVCTLCLVSRVLKRMSGAGPEPRWLEVVLDNALPANGPREFYQPATVANGHCTVFSWKGSADLFTLAAANALVLRPAYDPARRAGDTVRAMEISL
ncbi:MAG: molybdopterin molybdotransferase MoeA [Burkholderiales bacterium]|nr:molybdopterin molybdotransferase MoeA [Phycisphaerae bacterium]